MATVSKGEAPMTFLGDDIQKLVETAINAYLTGSGSFTSDTPPPVAFEVAGKSVSIQFAAPSFTVTVTG